ncbi:MAG TPA: AcvB/VirJ family lysyl-phosphatidylglycerol hydrolase [Thermoanaerobaculia bacterium]|nr:AcvB/VirJ family lysyl-phosphatidylglycerol hydrolase [Thermoanaerobaculia bacterium]
MNRPTVPRTFSLAAWSITAGLALSMAARTGMAAGAATAATSPTIAKIAAAKPAGPPAETLSFGRFGTVTLYHQTPQPKHVVLFVSGDGGWNLGVIDMAKALSELDSLVVGIDIRHYLKAAAAAHDRCTSAAVDFEALSQFVQKKLNRPDYTPPVLVGYSSGATLVYATLVQAPPSTFKGAVSLGFCPDLPLTKPFCAGHGLTFEPGPKGKGYNFLPTDTLESPFVALQGTIDETCLPAQTEAYVKKVKNGEIVMLPKVGHGFSVQPRWMPQFKEVFSRLTREDAPVGTPAGAPKAAPAGATGAGRKNTDVSGLPLVEVPAKPGLASDRLAVIVSGDGGWAGIDREVGNALAARGIPVVGLNSLSYFWKEKPPEVIGHDLERILNRYLGQWKKQRAILIGYSLGADVLPFMVNRLPPDLLKQVELIALLGPEKMASFEFHVTQWLGGSSKTDRPVLPEVQKLGGRVPLLCLYGKQETDSICPGLDPRLGKSIGFTGSHHFGGDYNALADRILKELPR